MKTVAVIGCGKATGTKVGWAIGHCHGQAVRRALPTARLLAVDPDPQNRAAFAAAFGLAEGDAFASTAQLYAALTPDLVCIATWPGLHAPQVREAVEHGVRRILCEKPLATNPGELRGMLRLCAERGALLAVAHQRRHAGAFQRARELLAEGVLGGPVVLEARVGEGWDMMSYTVHWFDMANFLLTSQPAAVTAGVDFTGATRYGHRVENAAVALVEYPGGHQAVFLSGPDHPFEDSPIVARGPRGWLRIRESGRLELFSEAGHEVITCPPGDFIGWFAAALTELASAPAGDAGGMLCAAERCAPATELVFAIQEAGRTGRRITLPVNFEYAPLEVAQHQPRTGGPAGSLVLIADDHVQSGSREAIAAALGEISGRPAVVLDATRDWAADFPADAGMIFLFHTHDAIGPAGAALLRNWVETGRPLGVLHCAVGAWRHWDEYHRWVGRVWVWDGPAASRHPYEPTRLRVVAPGLWPLPWDEAWIPQDEVFTHLGETAECVDVVVGEISSGASPQAWITRDHLNVMTWVPAHRSDMWSLPVMRDGLRALLAYGARRSAAAPAQAPLSAR